jgi:hypothetical protein
MSKPNQERRFAPAISSVYALAETTEWAMRKVVFGVALFLTLSAGAEAKYAPVETPRPTAPPDDSAMFVGPAGAMLESNYFRAPPQQQRSSDPNFCRLQLRVFDKTKLAQSCD